jgi:hypothetical protein
MNYEKKYLKYKNKYIQLNNQIGGTLEEDEAQEIVSSFPDLSTYSTTTPVINTLIRMCTKLRLFNKDNYNLLYQNQNRLINKLVIYLINNENPKKNSDVIKIIDKNYLLLLETLIVTINNSDNTTQNWDFFMHSDYDLPEGIINLLIYINKKNIENKEDKEDLIYLTLKLIDVIFNKMVKNTIFYHVPFTDKYCFFVAAVIFLEKNKHILNKKIINFIEKVKSYIQLLKSESLLINLGLEEYGNFEATNSKDIVNIVNKYKLDFEVTEEKIKEIFMQYFP